tara:strand:+ start:672 stop:2198 length:1527 start_codon:yes stop_codon:yes gene_type:complete
MKFIGQFIQSFIARFRDDVYLENIADGTVANDKFLGLDSNNKIVKETISSGTTDLTSDVTGTLPLGNGGTGQTTAQAALNALAAGTTSGRYLRGNGSNIVLAAISNSDIGTLNQDTTGSAATLTTARAFQTDLASTSTANFDGSAANTHGVTGTLAVGNGGTGAASLTDNAILLGNGSSAVEASSHLSYYTPTANQDYLRIGDGSTTLAGIITDNASALSIQVEGSTGTNVAGNDITFVAGTSTGNAAGGDFVFRSSAAGSSGTTVRASAEIAKLDNVGNLQVNGGLTVDSTSFVNSSGVVQVAAQTVIDHDQLANYAANEHFTQANITTVGTIGTGVWQGTAIATDYLKHKATFELAGYAVADGTNYMMADIMSGNKAPFLHDETSIGANGTTADNPAAFLRAAGTVMPYNGTLKIWKGWGASNGTPTVDIAIFKYTPTADDATSASLVLVKNTQITGAGNDNLKAFSETSFSVTVAAGDILITAIKGSVNAKTAYFTSTVEIEWTS